MLFIEQSISVSFLYHKNITKGIIATASSPQSDMALNNELTLNSDTEARQTAADEVQRVVSRPIEAFGGGLVVAMAGISSFLRLPRARNYSPCESSTGMRRSANCVGARARVTPPHLRIGRATLSFFFSSTESVAPRRSRGSLLRRRSPRTKL